MSNLRSILTASVAAFGTMFCASASQAATIDISARSKVYADGLACCIENNKSDLQDTTVSGNTAAEVEASITNRDDIVNGDVYPQSGTANGKSSVDAATGELKVEVTTSGEGYFGQFFVQASATARLTERFLAIGTGTVTAFMSVTGDYDFESESTLWPYGGEVIDPSTVPWNITGSLNLVSGNTSSDFLVNPADACRAGGSCTSASGSVYQMLVASLLVGDGTFLTLSSKLDMSLGSTTGFLDFGSTGKVFLTTTAGLTLTPSDSRFLSNPAFIAPVPIPAALPLLASGLGALGLIGWGRKQKPSCKMAVNDGVSQKPVL